jgi:hypothetical protein
VEGSSYPGPCIEKLGRNTKRASHDIRSQSRELYGTFSCDFLITQKPLVRVVGNLAKMQIGNLSITGIDLHH